MAFLATESLDISISMDHVEEFKPPNSEKVRIIVTNNDSLLTENLSKVKSRNRQLWQFTGNRVVAFKTESRTRKSSNGNAPFEHIQIIDPKTFTDHFCDPKNLAIEIRKRGEVLIQHWNDQYASKEKANKREKINLCYRLGKHSWRTITKREETILFLVLSTFGAANKRKKIERDFPIELEDINVLIKYKTTLDAKNKLDREDDGMSFDGYGFSLNLPDFLHLLNSSAFRKALIKAKELESKSPIKNIIRKHRLESLDENIESGSSSGKLTLKQPPAKRMKKTEKPINSNLLESNLSFLKENSTVTTEEELTQEHSPEVRNIENPTIENPDLENHISDQENSQNQKLYSNIENKSSELREEIEDYEEEPNIQEDN